MGTKRNEGKTVSAKRRSRETTGFVVIMKHRPLTLCKGTIDGAPPAGVLLYSKVGTIFVRRDTAQRAIDRTRVFGKSKNWPAWTEFNHGIFPVTTRVMSAASARRFKRKVDAMCRGDR
jgi:hypothetical protein